MLEQVADAIKRKDYQSANQLLQKLIQQEPENPWVMFYVARLYEARGKLEKADKEYRQLLRHTTHPKIMSQVRQRIGRLQVIKKEQREQNLAQFMTKPGSKELGVLILEPIDPEFKKAAAQKFSKIMQIDAYSARLQLPSRSWRLYRTGAIGELQFYTSCLRKADIPCFCFPIGQISQLNVYQVNYFHSISPSATVRCKTHKGQSGNFSFEWSEVSQLIEGLLPLFESSLEMDKDRKLYRKQKTLDYARFCDLHLPKRKTILRIIDQNYEFKNGITFSPQLQKNQPKELTTQRGNWNNLIYFLKQRLSNISVWSDFTAFAETALDFKEMLQQIESHIDLFRREETPWDEAFQLYSGLVFLKNFHQNN